MGPQERRAGPMLGAHAVPPVLLTGVALTRQRGHARHKDGLPDFRHSVSFTVFPPLNPQLSPPQKCPCWVCH